MSQRFRQAGHVKYVERAGVNTGHLVATIDDQETSAMRSDLRRLAIEQPHDVERRAIFGPSHDRSI